MFKFPLVSENLSELILISHNPSEFTTKTAVKVFAFPVKLVIVPPVVTISLDVKSITGTLDVKVKLIELSLVNDPLTTSVEVISIEGEELSRENEILEDSWLELPTTSVYLEDPTSIL